jgi:glutamyl-tRNA synthetase
MIRQHSGTLDSGAPMRHLPPNAIFRKDSIMTHVVTRFAPSPTGHLHIGGARTAIFCWLLARHYGGQFHLRIEDTDLLRSKQEYTDSILASMRWLGLDWDGELTYQTQRADVYSRYVDKLLESGHAYWCDCTPEEVEAMREAARQQGLKPRYNGRCRERGLGPGEGRCVRLKTPPAGKVVFDDMVKGRIAVDVSELDDMVIRRADGMPTYNMAVVVDDYEMGITHVIRGDDHVSNTPRQILIYEALGLPVPTFGHVPMILGPDKQKLSKRHGARAVIEYQHDGLLPQALVNYLVRLGWSHGNQELFSREELIEFFDGKNLNPASAAFDPAKLEWCNAHYMREMPLEELAGLAAPFVREAGLGDLPQERLLPLCVMFRERANNLKALAEAFRPLVIPAAELAYAEKDANKHFTDAGREHLRRLAAVFAACEPFTAEALDAALNAYVADNGLKFKEVAPPLRTALMGFMGGSHLKDIMAFLGREETLARLKRAAG